MTCYVSIYTITPVVIMLYLVALFNVYSKYIIYITLLCVKIFFFFYDTVQNVLSIFKNCNNILPY